MTFKRVYRRLNRGTAGPLWRRVLARSAPSLHDQCDCPLPTFSPAGSFSIHVTPPGHPYVDCRLFRPRQEWIAAVSEFVGTSHSGALAARRIGILTFRRVQGYCRLFNLLRRPLSTYLSSLPLRVASIPEWTPFSHFFKNLQSQPQPQPQPDPTSGAARDGDSPAISLLRPPHEH